VFEQFYDIVVCQPFFINGSEFLIMKRVLTLKESLNGSDFFLELSRFYDRFGMAPIFFGDIEISPKYRCDSGRENNTVGVSKRCLSHFTTLLCVSHFDAAKTGIHEESVANKRNTQKGLLRTLGSDLYTQVSR
jgi:hypothetical protein